MNKKWLGLWAVPFLALNLGASNRDIWVQEKLIVHSIKYFPFSPGKIQQIDVDITWKVAITTRLHIITHVGDTEYLTPPKGESLGLHPRNPGQRMVYSFYVPPEHYPSDGNGPVYLQILSRDGGYVSHGTVMHCREPETFRLEGEPLGTYTFKWLESYISEDGGDRYTITDYEKVRFEGMKPVFYGGRTNALPMDRWKATSHYLWGKKESFECEKATLYLLNDYDRFEIGYETMYERQHCRAFDLETFLDDSPLAYTGFRLAEETEVSPDGRYQRRKGEGGLFYRASRDLLFPPVEGNVPSTYEFVLVLEGADIGGGMEYVYPFTYVKETNYVGPCASSDYCVAEVD